MLTFAYVIIKIPEKDQIDLEEKLHGFAIFESQINTNTTDD